MENQVAAVVVTYNRKELLDKCIACLLKQKGYSCDILVIDNASTDGTEQMIRSRYRIKAVHYYNTGENLGGAGGFEYGLKEAVSSGYQYVWIMDDDTLPTETALFELFQADERLLGKWGCLSSVAYWTDGSICKMNIQKKTIFQHIGEKEYGSEYAPIIMCSFVSLLVKSSVIQEVGLPLGDYFIWTDDYEYTGRISRKYPCFVVPGSKVIHAMKNHTRVNFATDTEDRIPRYWYIYRNDIHCYRQYGLKGWCYIVLKDVYTVLNILRYSKKHKIGKIKILLKGVKDGMKFMPEIQMLEVYSKNLPGGGITESNLFSLSRRNREMVDAA